MVPTSKIRIDKWLWAVRIFKTRNLATIACNAGKVKINGKRIKPSKPILIDETVTIQKGVIKYIYKITGLLEKRASAQVALENYLDLTTEDEKFKSKIYKFQPFVSRGKGLGRPTKKDRRNIEKLKWEK